MCDFFDAAARIHENNTNRRGKVQRCGGVNRPTTRSCLDVALAREESDWPRWLPIPDAVDVVPIDLMRQRLRLIEHRPLLIHEDDVLHFRRIQHLGQKHPHVSETAAQIYQAVGSRSHRHSRGHSLARINNRLRVGQYTKQKKSRFRQR